MAIFGRSKKSKQTPGPPLSPSNPQSNQQQNQGGPYLVPNPPRWAYVEQRPNTSNGSGPAQSQGWLVAPTPPPQYQPVAIPQNYLAPPPPLSGRYQKTGTISQLNLSSVTNLLAGDVPACVPGARFFNNEVAALQGTQYICQGAALCDVISSKFDAIITLIDGERFSGDERELAVHSPPLPIWQQQQESGSAVRNIPKGKSKGMVNNSISSVLVSTNYFAKVNLYANSRLPPDLPPMKL